MFGNVCFVTMTWNSPLNRGLGSDTCHQALWSAFLIKYNPHTSWGKICTFLVCFSSFSSGFPSTTITIIIIIVPAHWDTVCLQHLCGDCLFSPIAMVNWAKCYTASWLYFLESANSKKLHLKKTSVIPFRTDKASTDSMCIKGIRWWVKAGPKLCPDHVAMMFTFFHIISI